MQVVAVAATGASGVVLAALQPAGATGLAAAPPCGSRSRGCRSVLGVALAGAATVALDVAVALGGGSAAAVVAATLLCALLGLVA